MEEYRLELIKKIESFRNLKDNWNDNGANPISKKVIDKVINLILELNPINNIKVFPTANNSIQLEWENANLYLELEVFEDRVEWYQSVNE